MSQVKKSLYKIHLTGGIERVPAIILVVSLAIIVLYSPLYTKIAGGFIILIFWGALAKLNASDAIYLSVLMKYVVQQKFYYAQAMETSRNKKMKYNFKP